ncbi:LysR family transcriptional regulator [Rhodobium gokarnense]|uniref:DNA-binding transcriptional LysR family regulator n=1 Tax=Rhodobium gokarnense TaxID=364296 RepID=A0ABT3H7E9_9HYPH|nr:LysR family transcriptional regulator [Rhodobium gokarnense]MCW2306310.1 DNA-binding transcriptional LysR family regulator [Rhodobium gokarnense]
MKNDFLRSAERFAAVVEEGSIQGAARRLNLSQPSLTLAISKIEEGFGTRLFERGRRGVELTDAGRILYARTRAILAEGSMAMREISDLTGGRMGRFHIRAGSSWGHCFLPQIVADLQSEFPSIEILFNIGNTDEAYPQLCAGEVDAIIGKTETPFEPEKGIALIPLAKIRFVLVCAVGHPLASLPIVRREDLQDHDFVAYEPDIDEQHSGLTAMAFGSGPPPKIALRTRSPHAALDMVATGRFVTCLTRPFVEKYRSADLKILKTDLELHEIQSGIAYRDTLTLTDPFRRLLSMLKRAAQRIEDLG